MRPQWPHHARRAETCPTRHLRPPCLCPRSPSIRMSSCRCLLVVLTLLVGGLPPPAPNGRRMGCPVLWHYANRPLFLQLQVGRPGVVSPAMSLVAGVAGRPWISFLHSLVIAVGQTSDRSSARVPHADIVPTSFMHLCRRCVVRPPRALFVFPPRQAPKARNQSNRNLQLSRFTTFSKVDFVSPPAPGPFVFDA